MIGALAALLSLQLLGEALVQLLKLPLPGPVMGMAMLVALLTLQPRWAKTLKETAQTLLQHLSLLFVPAGVGIMLHLQRLGDEAMAIVVALVISTWTGLAVAALVMSRLMRSGKGADDERSPD